MVVHYQTGLMMNKISLNLRYILAVVHDHWVLLVWVLLVRVLLVRVHDGFHFDRLRSEINAVEKNRELPDIG